VKIAHLNDALPEFSPSCARYTNAYNIRYNNIYWQVQETSKEIYYFYGAYYDNRPLAPYAPSIRILSVVTTRIPEVELFCQIWFNGESKPAFAKVSEPRMTRILEKKSHGVSRFSVMYTCSGTRNLIFQRIRNCNHLC
jgi:hypothetical protein